MREFKRFSDLIGAICLKSGLAFFAILLALPLAAAAQTTTAVIVGTIADSSGSPVSGAGVTARNTETGLTRTVTTGADGNFRLEFLPVGNYVIDVTATSGFKKASRTGIVLAVGDTSRVDITLEVGAVTEEVTITDAPPEVNTNSPELGRTVLTREIENLPLVERNVYLI
jgi:hypothetical protein